MRDLSCGDLRIFLEVEVHRVYCGRCQTVRQEKLAFLADRRFYTKRFAFYVGRRCSASTIKDVARELHLDWKTVKELEKQYLREQLRRAGQPRPKVIGIDEVQFFDPGIVDVVTKLADMGKRVIVAGLDQDYLGKPFEPVPTLLAIAEYITKTLAVCVRCGNPANHTQRLIESEERIVVGASGMYEARCRRCFEPLLKKAADG